MLQRRPAPLYRAAALTLITALVVGGCAAVPSGGPRRGVSGSSSGLSNPTSTPTATSASGSGSPATGRPIPAASPTSDEPSCSELAGRLTMAEQVGQLSMVAVASTGLDQTTASTLASTRTGSAILLGDSGIGQAGTRAVVSDVRKAIDEPNGVRAFVAVDQEGGQVQRLRAPDSTGSRQRWSRPGCPISP